MSEPTRTDFAAVTAEAIQRDGTLTRDLRIAEWMHRSRPHGEYRGSAGDFSVVASSGQSAAVGPSDWVVRIGGQFYPCPPLLFEALISVDPPTTLCGECHDPFRPVC